MLFFKSVKSLRCFLVDLTPKTVLFL